MNFGLVEIGAVKNCPRVELPGYVNKGTTLIRCGTLRVSDSFISPGDVVLVDPEYAILQLYEISPSAGMLAFWPSPSPPLLAYVTANANNRE